MDIKLIKEVIAIMEEAGLTHFRYKADGVEIELGKQAAPPQTAPVTPLNAPTIEEKSAPESNPYADAKSLTAPMVGVYHGAKKSGAPIKAGTKLSRGDVVCVIEAMKLMNDIAMPEDGVVEHIAVSEGGLVEFGQLLIYYR